MGRLVYPQPCADQHVLSPLWAAPSGASRRAERRLRARIQRFTGAYRSVSGIRRSRRLRIVIHDGPGNECPVAASRYVAPRVCAAEPGSAQRRPGTRPAVTYCGLMYPCLPEPIAEREAQAVCGSVYPPMTSMAATRPTDVQLAAVWKVPAQRSVVGPASTVLAPLHRDRNRSSAGLLPDRHDSVCPTQSLPVGLTPRVMTIKPLVRATLTGVGEGTRTPGPQDHNLVL